MKKVLAIMLIVVLSTGIFVTAFSTGKTLWEVYRPDYTVTFNGEVLNGNTQFSILEKEGQTYLSLEDWGNLLDASVVWEDEQTVIFDGMSSRHGRYLFNDDQTALAIAKVLCEEKFPTKISEKTGYYPGGITSPELLYWVYVVFDTSAWTEEQKADYEFFKDNADVQVTIWQDDNRISVIERNKENRREQI